MKIGYVSDERYVALPDVLLEFVDDAGQSWETRSRASGSVWLDLPAGHYRVILRKDGFGAKISHVTLPLCEPVQFRLLDAKDRERIGMLAGHDCLDVVLTRLPLHCCALIRRHWLSTGTFQISSAYCRIVRSEENQPTCAVFPMAIEYHFLGVLQASSTRFCAAA